MEDFIGRAGSAAQSGYDAFKDGAHTGYGAFKDGAHTGFKSASVGWGKVKTKMNIPETNFQYKQPEFSKIVMQMSNKSEATMNMMEKRLKSAKKMLPRQKTEFELMKERLKHVEFSDEEKGMLTKEQMDEVSRKVGDAKKILMELEREGKSKGFVLENFIENYPEWADELEYLKTSGIEIDFDGLLNARKRIIIRDIFFDPVAAERRRRAAEEAARLVQEREMELERLRLLAEQDRINALEDEKNRLKREQEEKLRKLKQEEEERLRAEREEEEKLRKYAEKERLKLQLDELRRGQQEEEIKAKRIGVLRKFSTNEGPDESTDVGKLKFDGFGENEKKSRRRSVGKLNNPFENQNNAPNKPRSRRTSKVSSKLNTPLDGPIAEDPLRRKSRSKANSKSGSRAGSRRSSLTSQQSEVSQQTPVINQEDFLQAVAGLEDLASKAGEFSEE